MTRSGRILVALALSMAAGAAARAESVAGLVEEGNRLFKERRFNEALEKYRRAGQLDPRSAAVHYNIGNVLSELGQPDKAYDEFRQAFAAREKELAEGARFNAGNSHLARRNWQEAIRNYQEALRLAPGDIDAKKNLELALRQMEQEREKQRQQQQQGGRQDQPPQEDDQGKGGKDPSSRERREQDRGDQKRNEERSGQPPPGQEQRPGAPQREKLTREEAMRLLNAVRGQDKGARNPLVTPPPDRKPERDW